MPLLKLTLEPWNLGTLEPWNLGTLRASERSEGFDVVRDGGIEDGCVPCCDRGWKSGLCQRLSVYGAYCSRNSVMV